MPETDEAIIGVRSCGCVTLAITFLDLPKTKREQREEDTMFAEYIRSGGEVRHTTVGEARAMPDFLPAQCPHNPKGWGVEHSTEGEG